MDQTAAIRRERIAIPGVPYAGWVADGIGYIQHSDFTEGSYDELRAALEALQREGELRGLILDYRSNGGGILQEAVKILSMFVPKGTEVVSMRGRMKELDATFVTQSEPIDTQIPVAVLINSSSASAAFSIFSAWSRRNSFRAALKPLMMLPALRVSLKSVLWQRRRRILHGRMKSASRSLQRESSSRTEQQERPGAAFKACDAEIQTQQR